MLLAACAAVPVTPSTQTPFHLGPRESRAVVLTRVAAPWWAPAFVVTGKFIDSLPEYAAVPRLEHKAYTWSDQREFGGLYLWPDRSSAEAFFDARWHERVRQVRGVDGEARVFDAWWTLEGEPPQGTALPHHALRATGAVTWLSVEGVADVEAALRRLAGVCGQTPGLIRASLVSEGPGAAGLIELWNSRAQAEAAWPEARLKEAEQLMGGTATLHWFSSPVFLDVAADRAVVHP